MFNQNPDILRGRQEIADYIGVSIDTLNSLRKYYEKEGNPMPIFRMGPRELQMSKTKFEKWRDKLTD